MTDSRKPIYRVSINMDADGGMWLTSDHGEDVFIDFHLDEKTVEQLEHDLACLHGRFFRDEISKNLYEAINILHGIFWKAKDRWYKPKEGDGEDTDPAD